MGQSDFDGDRVDIGCFLDGGQNRVRLGQSGVGTC